MTNHEDPEVYYSSIEERFLARDGVQLGRSFTSPGLAYHDTIFALNSEAGLVVRVGADAAAQAITEEHGLPYRSSRFHVSPSWLLVPFSAEDPQRWAHYVDIAYTYARSHSRDDDR